MCFSFFLVGKRYEEGNKRKYNPGTGPVVGNVCEECGRQFHIGGPIWIDPIHDMNFVKGLLQSVEKERDCYGTYPRIKSRLVMFLVVIAPPVIVRSSSCNKRPLPVNSLKYVSIT